MWIRGSTREWQEGEAEETDGAAGSRKEPGFDPQDYGNPLGVFILPYVCGVPFRLSGMCSVEIHFSSTFYYVIGKKIEVRARRERSGCC